MNTTTAATAEHAARLANKGALKDAVMLYRQVLDREPDHLEALQFLAWQELCAGRLESSISMLRHARDLAPHYPAVHVALGQAQLQSGDWANANDSFDHALRLKPELAPALLYKGFALERLFERNAAASAFHGALYHAQRSGEWAAFDRLPPDLRQMISYAARCVRDRRYEMLHEAIEPLRERYGADALKRIEQCVAVYLHDVSPDYPDPRQHPKFLFIPGLSTEPFFHDHKYFPWLSELEVAVNEIRVEFLSAKRASARFQPVLTAHHGLQIPDDWRPLSNTMQWNGLYFYRHGERYSDNCRQCPVTADLLDRLPLIRLPGHSPEAHFSVLEPGAHIPVHTGVTNARLVVHLPLIIPPDCGIRIAGETHRWTEGECIVFDDTFEHEAWNHSSATRTILIFDTWNPALTQAERDGVSKLVQTISHTQLLQD